MLREKHYKDVMSGHVKKLSRLMHKTVDVVDKHGKNIPSYKLSFFEKFVLCRGLNFAFTRDVRPLEIKVSFDKAYWMLLPKLSDDQKELVASTLRSIALNYAKSKGPRPPKALLTRGPDKEISVVVMDKWSTLNWQLKLPN